VFKASMHEKVVIIDGKGHLIGRLASILAKELLNGQKVVVVRCEEIQISGSLFRNQLIWSKFLQHRGNTNPKRGPIHYRSPARMLWRTIRGMMPHFTKRAQAALDRLKVFEGIPHPYDRMKRVVVPGALRVLRLKPGRKYCRLGDLASSVGWAHNGLIEKLENKRKTKSSAFYLKKRGLSMLKAKAISNLGDKLGGGASGAGGPSSSAIESAPTETKEKSKKPASKPAPKPAADKPKGAPAKPVEKKDASEKKAAPPKKDAPPKKEKKEAAPKGKPKEKAEKPVEPAEDD